MRYVGILVVVGLLGGCASVPTAPPYWAGRDQVALRRDHYECKIDAIGASQAAPRVGIATAVPVTRGFAVGGGVMLSDDPGVRVYHDCMTRREHILVIPHDWAEQHNAWLPGTCTPRSGQPSDYERCVTENTIRPVAAPPGYEAFTQP